MGEGGVRVGMGEEGVKGGYGRGRGEGWVWEREG